MVRVAGDADAEVGLFATFHLKPFAVQVSAVVQFLDLTHKLVSEGVAAFARLPIVDSLGGIAAESEDIANTEKVMIDE